MSDLPDPRHWLDMIARHADLPLESLALEEATVKRAKLYRLKFGTALPLGGAWRHREAMGLALMTLKSITKERQETMDVLKRWLDAAWGKPISSDEIAALYLAIDERRKSLMLGPVA